MQRTNRLLHYTVIGVTTFLVVRTIVKRVVCKPTQSGHDVKQFLRVHYCSYKPTELYKPTDRTNVCGNTQLSYYAG